MRVEEQQLKAFLLDAGLISSSQLSEAEKKSKQLNKKIEDILLNEGLISFDDLVKLKAYVLGIPFVDLEKEIIKPEILQIIPEPIAKNHNIIAFRKYGQELEVAMLDPEDLQTIDFIKKKSNLKILPRLTTIASIKNALRQYQKSLEVEFGEIIKKEAGEVKALKEVKEGKEVQEKEKLEKMAEDLPIIRIVDTLIKHAILQNASDIHIEPLEKEVLVRYRIDGILREAMTLPRAVEAGVVARIKVLANLKLDEHRLPQDGRFKIESEDQRISFRVSILPVYDGEKVVMRILPESAKGFTLENLGLYGEALEKIHRAIKKPIGMVLVTGPTGSGKTTTLYSLMEILNKPGVNISTVEDPIEYRMPHINQTQVKPQIGLTFASGLRSLVRQDPDIIMVGEIRDNETAYLAINAALTGHLVLSTLHTNNAAGALPRLLDMKVEPFLIASTLQVILAQRLIRRLCEEKEKYFLTEVELNALNEEFNMEEILKILKQEKVINPKATWKDIPLYRPKKTKECLDGYKGRIGIYEVLEVTESIKELINRKASMDEVEKQAITEGMITLLQDGFIKFAKGITSLEEILRVTRE